ncbi:MAG: TIGR01777 family protein [Acidobacteria bacterium]|nr:TIGR01777 family protein [Acidobacteriota bacterium]
MRILVTGASGFIGSAVVSFLTDHQHEVVRLGRATSFTPAEIRWDPAAGKLDPARLAELNAVVHLAGENITGRWTPAKKERIRTSRVNGTRLLAEALTHASPPPKVLVCASAVGYYGDRGEEVLREESPPGRGFLADVCQEWEAASRPAAERSLRVVHLRIGVVLDPAGGALKQMLPPFRLGLGGVIGSGGQWMSWITRDELANVIHFALTTEGLRGPVNAVAPQVATNREFTKTLGRVLSRPTVFPMPAFAARLVFGEMADELLLASARVEPARLAASGYKFLHPELESALRQMLGE